MDGMDTKLVLQKEIIRSRFENGFKTYNDQAIVQEHVAQKLVEYMSILPNDFNKVLEVGAGTGILTRALLDSPLKIHQYEVNDIVVSMFPAIASLIAKKGVKHIIENMGDIEEISLMSNSSLIVSSSVFQWVQDMPALLDKFSHSQDSGDYLAFATYTQGTFNEFHQASGVGLDYLDASAIRDMLERDYEIICENSEVCMLDFDSPRDVLLHIQKTGVNGLGVTWKKSQYLQFLANYPSMNEKYKLTYIPTYFIAKRK